MRKLFVLSISFLLLLGSCEEKDLEPEVDIKLLNPGLLPNQALVKFSEIELYSDTITFFTLKVNYLPQNEINVPEIKEGFLKYSLSYTLTGEEGEIEMLQEIINDSTVILNIKNPLISNKKYLLKVFAKWQKKIGTDAAWEDCQSFYNEEFYQTIITSLHPDLLSPDLLPKYALVEFRENELNCNIATSFKLGVNYLPQNEICIFRTGNGFLRYNLSYTLTGEDGEVEMEHEVINDSIIILNSKKPLISNKNYSLQIFAKWQKKIGINGIWEDCEDDYNEEISQNVITSLPLSELIITKSDFIFQYPLDRQFNYLEEEYPKGYFRLTNEKQKQLMLNNGIIKLLNVKTGIFNTIELVYNESLDVFEYELQSTFLENESVYEISLLITETEEVIYSYYFKTSKYNSFSEKWDMLKTCFFGPWRDNVYDDDYPYSGIANYLQKINVTIQQEILDYYEINSNRFSGSTMPLIQFETHVPEEWKTTAEWQIYSWNSLSYERQNTDCKKYGFPPLRAIYCLAADWWAVKLSDESISGNIEYPDMPWLGICVWEVQNFMKYDSWTAHINASEINENDRDENQNIAAGNYQNMDRLSLDFALGDDVYPLVNVYYILPGLKIETTKIDNFQL